MGDPAVTFTLLIIIIIFFTSLYVWHKISLKKSVYMATETFQPKTVKKTTVSAESLRCTFCSGIDDVVHFKNKPICMNCMLMIADRHKSGCYKDIVRAKRIQQEYVEKARKNKSR